MTLESKLKVLEKREKGESWVFAGEKFSMLYLQQ